MESKQGAVDWLIKLYQQTGKIDIFDLEVANQMFQEQIKDAYENGVSDENESNLSGLFTNAEQYYNETYNK
jgi:hypothetical protein